MKSIKLCSKYTTSKIIDQKPERIEVSVCLLGEINKEHGWFLAPFKLKKILQDSINSTPEEYFYNENLHKLSKKLQNSFQPHKLSKLEVQCFNQKLVYEA